MKKSGLGRGLGSLIPKKEPLQNISAEIQRTPVVMEDERGNNKGRILHLDVNKIDANPYQPRESFREEELSDLTASILEHGVLQPLIVTEKEDGRYELIAGERRLRASKLAGLKDVPAIAREADNFGKLQLAIIENIQRADLNPLEEANSFRQLAEEFKMTHDDVAKRVGKSRSFVSNTLRLLNLTPEIKAAISDGKINSSQARSLVSLEGDKQKELFDRIVNNKLTSRDVEEEARKVAVKTHTRIIKRDPIITAKEEQLQRALGTKISIKKKGEKGQILVDFYSEEELDSIIDKITS